MGRTYLGRGAGGIAVLAVAAVLATCAVRPGELPLEPHPERLTWAEQIDWEAARDEATAVLSNYLAIDTTNPPGREAIGAAYLGSLLQSEGIEVSTHAFAPGRDNLVARLRSADPVEAPLCLVSHIDVASAEAEAWQQPPFSGLVDEDGLIWGRGALDMKSVGVLQLLSMVWLKRLDVPLRRDVILLAVADEEVDNRGIDFLVDEHWDEIGCSHAINEGGFGVRDALFDGLTTFTVSFTEKGALWLRMVAEGEPGHGSTPMPESAPARLQRALNALARRKVKPTWHEQTYVLLDAVGERVGGLTGAVLRSPTLVRGLAAGKLMGHPVSRSMLVNTVNVTGFGGAQEPNVVPSKVWAQIDARLLPGVGPDEVLAELHTLVADVDGISFEVLHAMQAQESPTDDPVYAAIVRRVKAEWPDAAVGPLIMPGTTDSHWLRAKGVHAYGFAPLLFDQDELKGMHGHDERIHRDNLARGLQVMLRFVLDVAAAGDVDPDAAAPELADARAGAP